FHRLRHLFPHRFSPRLQRPEPGTRRQPVPHLFRSRLVTGQRPPRHHRHHPAEGRSITSPKTSREVRVSFHHFDFRLANHDSRFTIHDSPPPMLLVID